MNLLLDWPKLVELSKRYAFTEPGKELLTLLEDAHHWAKNLSQANLFQEETQEAIFLTERDVLWEPMNGLHDPFATINRLKQGSVLDVQELALLKKWLEVIEVWISVPKEELKGDKFRKAVAGLPNPASSLKILRSILTDKGELSEKASPKLAGLHNEIRSLQNEIHTTLDQILKRLQLQKAAQDKFYDVRDGRYVVPVKIGSQHELPGIVHETSVSHQTAYIEPKEIENLNHRLKQKKGELLQEIYTILMDTSNKLQPQSDLFLTSFKSLVHWDHVQAKARLAKTYSGKPIQVVEERAFKIRGSAHPLLWSTHPINSIVRNDVDFGPPIQTLLITGPNTGGKTVILKLLGVAAICARTGFFLPASEKSIVPYFEQIFTDLGDAQSIELQLSSFAGHLNTYKRILESITDMSLVLIDELNSATDPEEGAALSRAILETIMEKGAIVVTTTHDPYLKSLAYQENDGKGASKILNVSMTFDESTERPTYKIAMGVPGSSRALETAKRLGIPKNILDLAKKYLSNKHVDFEKTISRLESHARDAEVAYEKADAIRKQAEKLRDEWIETTKKSAQDLLATTKQKLKRTLEEAQDQLRVVVKNLNETRTRKGVDDSRHAFSSIENRAIESFERGLKEEAPEVAELLAKQSTQEESGELALKPGMSVRVPKWKSIGTIKEVKSDRVQVTVGNITVSLALNEIEVLRDQVQKKEKITVSGALSEGAESNKLDIRGARLDDAMTELQVFLDRAFRDRSLQEVSIVHGLGTGALREGTRNLLKRLPYIKSYRDGGAGQGGAGCTVILFDRD